jgi:hypothetical protein
MRRIVASAVCIALAVLVAMPAVVLARGHGQGLATAPGQVKKEEPPPDEGPAVTAPEAPVQDTEEEAADAAIPPGHESAVGRGHAEAPGQGHARERLGEDPAVAPDVPGDWGPSEDASGTPDPKRVGIERALERLEANLARAEQKMADGSKWQLPPGLVKTIDKFTEWLGMDDTVEDPGDDGSNDTSPTPDPDDGSSEETETPTEEPPPPIFS